MKTIIKFMIIVLSTMLCINASNAQNFNLEPQESETNIVGLKAAFPSFKKTEYEGYKTMSGAYTPYAYLKLKNNWSLYAEIPVIIANSDYEKETGLGNLFFAFRKNLNTEQTSRISFGAFLPTISKEKYQVNKIGFSSNYYRLSQYARAATIYGNYAYHTSGADDLIFGLEIGPELLIPVDGDGAELELLMHFGAKAGYKISKVWLWSEFNGIMIVTEPDMDLNDRLVSQLMFGGQLNFKKIKPGIFYGIPLNKYTREYQNGIIGLKLDVGI
jgi:hypothetical protein